MQRHANGEDGLNAIANAVPARFDQINHQLITSTYTTNKYGNPLKPGAQQPQQNAACSCG
jgi:hypothetical protein